MKMERIWAMPNHWTFIIKPIKELLKQEMDDGLWIDPFAGEHSPAAIKNDLNLKRPTEFHMDALDFLKTFADNSVDGVLYDPPYSSNQVKRHYENIGLKHWNGQATYWKLCKNEMARILRPGGKVICFGWNSTGCGKTRGFSMHRVLLVPHGGSRYDTICTVETKSSLLDEKAAEIAPPDELGKERKSA